MDGFQQRCKVSGGPLLGGAVRGRCLVLMKPLSALSLIHCNGQWTTHHRKPQALVLPFLPPERKTSPVIFRGIRWVVCSGSVTRGQRWSRATAAATLTCYIFIYFLHPQGVTLNRHCALIAYVRCGNGTMVGCWVKPFYLINSKPTSGPSRCHLM